MMKYFTMIKEISFAQMDRPARDEIATLIAKGPNHSFLPLRLMIMKFLLSELQQRERDAARIKHTRTQYN